MSRTRALKGAVKLACPLVKTFSRRMATSPPQPTTPLPTSTVNPMMPSPKKASAVVNEEKLAAKSLSRALEKQAAGDACVVIGMDEAGRGPLAGPVVCAACFIPFDAENIPGIADSKLLSEPEREFLFEKLTTHPDVKYATNIVTHTEIDEINILQASLQGMARATHSLLAQLNFTQGSSQFASSVVGLVDGNKMPSLTIPAKTVVQGDRKIYSIAAASIIAKVTRDRIMVELDRQYPQYELALHKGYPTPRHFALLSKWGASEIHRRSYAPVRKAIENWDRKTAKGEQEEGLDGKQKEGVDEELTGRGKRKRKSAIDVMEAPTISNKAKPDSKTKLPTSISKPESKSADKSSGRKSIGRKKHIEAAKAAPISSIRRSSRLANKQEV